VVSASSPFEAAARSDDDDGLNNPLKRNHNAASAHGDDSSRVADATAKRKPI
jgi:hypothetical protein